MWLDKIKQTWGWAEALRASGETDASLRRKLQRGQIKLAKTSSGRTKVTLRDIAVLRVSRVLCDIGVDAKRAFDLAKKAVAEVFKEEHPPLSIAFLIMRRTSDGTAIDYEYEFIKLTTPTEYARQIIAIMRPEDPERPPGSVIGSPVQAMVIDAWSGLPNLPEAIATLVRKHAEEMARLQNMDLIERSSPADAAVSVLVSGADDPATPNLHQPRATETGPA
jgi:hypothetical protein